MSRIPSGSSGASASRVRQTPSTSSFATSHSSSHADTAALALASAAVFRSLVFAGSVPIEVTLAQSELPPNADRAIDAYYLQAPRISYLPLVLAQVRKYFVDLVLDDTSAASLTTDDLWFEADGVPLKWHWPIGLLYDYHHLATHPSLLPPPPLPAPASFSAGSSDSSTLPNSLASVFAPLSAPSAADLSFPTADSSSHATLRAPPSSSAAPPRPRTPSSVRSVGPARGPGAPWRVTLHLRDPPTEQLLVSNRVDDARAGYMAMVKEADYVRWGNTKRVTNLRKEQQDNLWEGVVQNDYDKFWHVASKLVPLPALPSSAASRSPTPSSSFGPTGSDGRLPDANGTRSVPLRVYLPEGAPVVQDVVPPLQQDGSPTTLHQALSTLLPLLFPPAPPPPPPASSSSSSAAAAAAAAVPAPLAHALVQGILVPLEAELGWLGACMPGADGWVAVVVVVLVLGGDEER